MSINYADAIDEMFGTVKAVNDALSTGILGYVPELRYQSVALGTKPAMDKVWLRASQMNVTEDQVSLSDVNETRMFETIGLLNVQVFCPRDVASSIENGRALAGVLRDAFRQQSKSGEIWYRKQKMVELPETADNYPINVIVEFRYKTIHARGFNGTVAGVVDMPSLIYPKVALASNNAAIVKAAAGTVTGWSIYNNAGYPIFVKLYNKLTIPIPGTDVPLQTIGVQAGASSLITSAGYSYSLGIGIAITKLIDDLDNTPVAAKDCVLDLFYQ